MIDPRDKIDIDGTKNRNHAPSLFRLPSSMRMMPCLNKGLGF